MMNNFNARYFVVLALLSVLLIIFTVNLPYGSNSLGFQGKNLFLKFAVKHTNQTDIINTVENNEKTDIVNAIESIEKFHNVSRKETNFIRFDKKLIRMVFYTGFFGALPWGYFRPKKNYSAECNYDFKCELIYEPNQFESADILFFHARDMPSTQQLDKLKEKVKDKKQYWVYFGVENPYNNPPVQPLNKYFDFVSTYRYSSDFRFPYGYSKLLTLEERKVAMKKNYAKGRTKKVAWMVSHCGPIREKLVARFLELGLKLDVGGGCSRNYQNKMKCTNKECLREYKFYFAAENNLCNEYISEKYWEHSLANELVPIVLGGTNYSDPKMAIPGSFINALDFKTPKDLVDYINKVDANDTLYNEYFAWKKTYKDVVEYYNGCSELLNNFCNRLHTGTFRRNDPLISSINGQEECAENEKFYLKWVTV